MQTFTITITLQLPDGLQPLIQIIPAQPTTTDVQPGDLHVAGSGDPQVPGSRDLHVAADPHVSRDPHVGQEHVQDHPHVRESANPHVGRHDHPVHTSTPLSSNGRETYARQLLESFGFHDVDKLLSQFAAERVIDVCTSARGRTDLANPAGYINTVLRRGWRLPAGTNKPKGRSQ